MAVTTIASAFMTVYEPRIIAKIIDLLITKGMDSIMLSATFCAYK